MYNAFTFYGVVSGSLYKIVRIFVYVFYTLLEVNNKHPLLFDPATYTHMCLMIHPCVKASV